ncbi:MAG: hypothetical protein AAFR27_06820, partial [Pseudomonadota bacterium]
GRIIWKRWPFWSSPSAKQLRQRVKDGEGKPADRQNTDDRGGREQRFVTLRQHKRRTVSPFCAP